MVELDECLHALEHRHLFQQESSVIEQAGAGADGGGGRERRRGRGLAGVPARLPAAAALSSGAACLPHMVARTQLADFETKEK